MAEAEPSRTRSRLLRIVAALAAVAAVAGALKLAGAFDDEEKPVDPAPLGAPKAEPPVPIDGPFAERIDVGGSPAAIGAHAETVVVAHATTPTATVIDAETAEPTEFALDETATAVAVAGDDVWLGLPESRGVERRSAVDLQAPGEVIELDAIPSAIAADAGGAWVMTENAVERVEPGSTEAVDRFGAGGFATAMAVADDAIWVVADNREVRRFDPESLEPADEVAEVPDASAIAVGEGYAWLVSSTAKLTRLDVDTMRRVGKPTRIEGALALAVGESAVWVTTANGRVVRVDPRSAQVFGESVRVGAEPRAISTAGRIAWVASAADGSVTGIAP